MAAPDGPLISVIMPVHNGAAFLERAVESVRHQLFAGWELVAVDDASTDTSRILLSELAAAEPRLRVLGRTHNGGPSAARNTALAAARGAWIAYLDCDDEYYPDYLGRIAAHAAGPGEVRISAYDLLEERPGHPKHGRISAWQPRAVFGRLLRENVVVPLGVAHRRTLLDRSGWFDESLQREVDFDLWQRFVRAGARFTFLPGKSGLYHVRANSVSRTVPRRAAPAVPTQAAPALPSPAILIEAELGGQVRPLWIAAAEAWRVRPVLSGQEYGPVMPGVLRERPVVLDVGANVGLFTLYTKAAIHPGAVIHCFEPFAPNVTLLRANTAGLADVHIHPMALGAADGTGVLYLHPDNAGAHSLQPQRVAGPVGQARVPVADAGRVWDELALGEVDVLKLDTEGSEADILGALGPRLGSVRCVLAEFHTRPDRRRIDTLLTGFDLLAIRLHSPDRGVIQYVRSDLAPP